MKNIYFIIISLIFMIYIIYEIRKEKLSIKESFWWMISSLIMLILAIFPYSINWLSDIFKIEYPPSLLFVFCIIFLLFINFRNSKKISEQQLKIIKLAQKVSLLEEKKW
jgi:hypothetical protein